MVAAASPPASRLWAGLKMLGSGARASSKLSTACSVCDDHGAPRLDQDIEIAEGFSQCRMPLRSSRFVVTGDSFEQCEEAFHLGATATCSSFCKNACLLLLG